MDLKGDFALPHRVLPVVPLSESTLRRFAGVIYGNQITISYCFIIRTRWATSGINVIHLPVMDTH